ncbi:hypothetical protein TUBRATIS_001610 [Tubulinosema ratisbonensis]|uniref:Uncharacterized protein n=1 Tax=Tubulinosema ratisbonensis TaxID=291195 RepID=A0A437AQD5_9MICR|nr:hypothetical protein TUBRATIS_001610 [Tubulinosema ratisbonensis]
MLFYIIKLYCTTTSEDSSSYDSSEFADCNPLKPRGLIISKNIVGSYFSPAHQKELERKATFDQLVKIILYLQAKIRDIRKKNSQNPNHFINSRSLINDEKIVFDLVNILTRLEQTVLQRRRLKYTILFYNLGSKTLIYSAKKLFSHFPAENNLLN